MFRRRRLLPQRRRRSATFRRARAEPLPRVRGLGQWVCASPLWRLPLRTPRSLFVQRTRLLPDVRWPAHGRARCSPRRRGAPRRTRPPVGTELASSAPLPCGLEPRAVSRCASGLRPRPARLSASPCQTRRDCRWPQRCRHRHPTLRQRPPSQRSLPHQSDRRRLLPGAIGRARVFLLPPPTEQEVARLLATIYKRTLRLLRRRGLCPDTSGHSSTDPIGDGEPALAGLLQPRSSISAPRGPVPARPFCESAATRTLLG